MVHLVCVMHSKFSSSLLIELKVMMIDFDIPVSSL